MKQRNEQDPYSLSDEHRSYVIRELRESETGLLKDFLYEAIFVPEGVEPPARDIIEKVSMAVQKANYAVRLYEKVGFKTVDENDEEYIMVCDL